MDKKTKNLKKYVDDFFSQLTLYDDYKNEHNYKDLLQASIDLFLEHENDYTAYEIYETFFMIYQITPEDKSEELKTDSKLISESNTLLRLAKIMKQYEENTGELIEKQRDHFIHSVNVFLLGLAIYSQNQNYREIFSSYIMENSERYDKYYKLEDGSFSHEEFLYRWGIAALFHDIGYPVEIIGKELTKFIDDGVESISDSYDIKTALHFENFKEFNTIVKADPKFTKKFRNDYPDTNLLDLYKSTDIMAHKIATTLDDVDVHKLSKKLDTFVDYMAQEGFIDHGYFSAILVLNSYASLMQKHYMQKNNCNKYDYFFYPIVDSATAILLHNYYRNAMQEDFGQGQLNPSKNPIAYLLILCDELQEWNRKPLGIKNRKKSYVHELEIEINNENLFVDYIIKHGSVDLGFKEEKEGLLKKLLNINALFRRFYVDSYVRLDTNSPMEKTIPTETDTPDVLLRNIENIAVAIHENYREMKKAENKDIEPYEKQSPKMKMSNVRQAKSYPHKLNIIGCEIVPENDIRNPHIFTKEEVEVLAIEEHKEWCEEQLYTEWISHHDAINPDIMGINNTISQEEYEQFCEYNKEEKDRNPEITPKNKDEEKKIHANIVDWNELNEETKEYDREPIRKIPDILNTLGLKIVDTKIRLLTYEMHNRYKEFFKDKKIREFKDLPETTKYSNYKQTTFLVKLLSEQKYYIVPKESEGDAISSFSDDEIDEFAQREHENWYEEKIREGWEKESKDTEKTSPNIVEWKDLSQKIRDANKYTFKKLPETCDKVSLKIIKK